MAYVYASASFLLLTAATAVRQETPENVYYDVTTGTCNNGKYLLDNLSGTFAAARENTYYQDNEDCYWYIVVPDGYTIKVTFTTVLTLAAGDYLHVYESNGTSKLRGTLKNSHWGRPVNPINSAGRFLTFHFTSDGHERYYGFRAKYEAVDIDECRTNGGGCEYKCVNTAGSFRCECMAGFQVAQKSCIDPPTVVTGEVAVVYGRDALDVELTDMTQGTVLGYSGLRKAQEIRINVTLASRPALPPGHAYIPSVAVGIVDAGATFSIMRGHTEQLKANISCRIQPSPDNPMQYLNCYGSTYVIWEFMEGDVVSLTVFARNGGYVDIQPPAAHSGPLSSADRRYFQGQTVRRHVEVTFDFMKPFHCSISYNCQDKMLDVGNPIIKTANFSISWSGWADSTSGISNYTYMIFPLKTGSDGFLTEELRSNGSDIKAVVYPSDKLPVDVKLSHYGLYSVVLKVQDKAGHSTLARRCILYYDVNKHKPELVAGARVKIVRSSGGWSNGAGSEVTVDFHNVFVNRFLKDNGYLGDISSFSPAIEPGYDCKSISGVLNTNGIVKFLVAVGMYNSEAVAKLSQPTSWQVVADPSKQQYRLHVPKTAKVIRAWVKAVDLMGSEVIDRVTVKVYNSTPTISRQIVFNGRIHVEAQESVSGIHYIEWTLYILSTGSAVYGRNYSNSDGTCASPECTCRVEGGKCKFATLFLSPGGATLPDVTLRSEVTVVSNAGDAIKSQTMVRNSDLKLKTNSGVLVIGR
ncbi:uncharacterized protein LOC106161422 isoform X2 [Lingula anatina]|uniref:Uncharacterized protein LOC106161422 isoform X2 n=1 Tax=Lingula anatina TaxID=7574 RepID=A0A1S3I7J7_LINAN|nr:uncharacterized protein LOC106161422 isoform X2 [Lingula anatina]|eukprot:XP_013393826.1 uncharacterized protein LOC106161422 isoform X2 [Lingula anatina]